MITTRAPDGANNTTQSQASCEKWKSEEMEIWILVVKLVKDEETTIRIGQTFFPLSFEIWRRGRSFLTSLSEEREERGVQFSESQRKRRMSESEKFFLQWREFEGNLRASYVASLSTGDFSDVTLASRDGHRVIFVPYLLNLLMIQHSTINHIELSFVFPSAGCQPQAHLGLLLPLPGHLGLLQPQQLPSFDLADLQAADDLPPWLHLQRGGGGREGAALPVPQHWGKDAAQGPSQASSSGAQGCQGGWKNWRSCQIQRKNWGSDWKERRRLALCCLWQKRWWKQG